MLRKSSCPRNRSTALRLSWGLAITAFLAAGTTPAQAAYCPGLFAQIDVSTLPKNYRALLESERLNLRVQFYLEDPSYLQFFHDVKTAVALRTDGTAVLRRNKSLAIEAKIAPDADGGVRIVFESERLPTESGSLELQGLQLAIVRGLFESFSTTELPSVSVEWKFGWRVAGKMKGSLAELGIERARHLVGCGGFKKVYAATAGAAIGSGLGTVFGIIYDDGSTDDGFAPFVTGPIGASLGAWGAVRIACRNPSVQQGGYLLRFTRVAPPAPVGGNP
jgi:hypothetical protein